MPAHVARVHYRYSACIHVSAGSLRFISKAACGSRKDGHPAQLAPLQKAASPRLL